MDIHSISYFVFALGLLIPFYFLNYSQRKILFLLASYIFYGSYSILLLGTLVLSTLVNYALVSKKMSNWLVVLFNVLLLIFFKLFGAFQSNTLFISIGISFFTFQAISYGVDREKNISHSFLDFANYMSFFPQLIAGPIESFNFLTRQLQKPEFPKLVQIKTGIFLISIGLAKKLIIADRASLVVDNIYNNINDSNLTSLTLATILYTFQIFLDFSAYCDIAMGVGKCFGINLTKNFSQPYFSTSLTDFWRRWHTTFHIWLKNYVYKQLVGKKGWVIAVIAVFFISGAWHGLQLNFFLWAIYCLITFLIDRLILQKLQLPSVITLVTTFSFVSIGWIFFRIEDLADLSTFFRHLQFFEAVQITEPLTEFYYILTHPSESVWFGTFSIGDQQLKITSFDFITLISSISIWGLISFMHQKGKVFQYQIIGSVLLLFLIGLLGYNNSQPFIYLQF